MPATSYIAEETVEEAKEPNQKSPGKRSVFENNDPKNLIADVEDRDIGQNLKNDGSPTSLNKRQFLKIQTEEPISNINIQGPRINQAVIVKENDMPALFENMREFTGIVENPTIVKSQMIESNENFFHKSCSDHTFMLNNKTSTEMNERKIGQQTGLKRQESVVSGPSLEIDENIVYTYHLNSNSLKSVGPMNKSNQLNGKNCMIFNQEGILIFQGGFQNGIKFGLGCEFNDKVSGQIISKGYYKNDIKNGDFELFSEKGIVIFHGHFKSDKVHGWGSGIYPKFSSELKCIGPFIND